MIWNYMEKNNEIIRKTMKNDMLLYEIIWKKTMKLYEKQ